MRVPLSLTLLQAPSSATGPVPHPVAKCCCCCCRCRRRCRYLTVDRVTMLQECWQRILGLTSDMYTSPSTPSIQNCNIIRMYRTQTRVSFSTFGHTGEDINLCGGPLDFLASQPFFCADSRGERYAHGAMAAAFRGNLKNRCVIWGWLRGLGIGTGFLFCF